MALKFYNTLSRKKGVFKEIEKGKVKFYSCGPTVYWYQHIGNLRTYIFNDVLKRVLQYDGYKVKHVMNYTDVGHLTSDSDSGEDKMEVAAKKEKKTAQEIANYYAKVFEEDCDKLNIIPPNKICKATEHIKEQIKLIKQLEDKGLTYKTKDGVYFDSTKFKNYGRLALLNIEGLESGKRTDTRDKKNKTDFALWKFSDPKEDRQQEWESPWGVGFPGWHIECSAMSMRYLGETLDIHTGGVDHIPVHHTNEIAQSEAATGKRFANYWLHGEFLTNKGKKVSKSKGGLYTISELEKKGYIPLAYRYLCLGANYRTQLSFSLEMLDSAQNAYNRLKNICSELKDDNEENKKYLREFEKSIDDDLDMPKALSTLWDLLRDQKAKGKYRTVKKMDTVFGLNLLKIEKIEVPKEVQDLVSKREKARKDKDWGEADRIREELSKKGWVIEDTPSGARVKRG